MRRTRKRIKIQTPNRITRDLLDPAIPDTPRPREQRVIDALVSGEAPTLSNAMIRAGFHPTSKGVRNRFLPGGDLRQALDTALTKANLHVPRLLRRLSRNIDAKKSLVVKGRVLRVNDNDAQLRAVDIGLKLHERTGRLPALEEQGSGNTINVNVLVIDGKTARIDKIKTVKPLDATEEQ